ncbi:MAG: acetate kinase [Erysipelotrichaceae bacterium]|nr:acetate kinase [Erysipelotrichaceae bacterium]
MKVLSVNAGSSTLKFRLYEMPEEKLLMKGNIERIGLFDSHYSIRIGDNKIEKEAEIADHSDAVQILLNELIENKVINNLDEIKAVGHRVVHGGNKYSKSVILTNRVMKEINEISGLAPLHNPANLVGVSAFMEAIPSSVNVACFDTAFHQTMKESTYLYPVPYEWYIKYDVRKYGFHGLSHKYITETMKKLLKNEKPNLIICHIGNGASISAIKEGICIDTSMGFTPNAGIMMGTRCGDIDHTMIEYISKKTGFSTEKINEILNKESGLQGIAGMSDLRDLDRAYEAREEKVLLAFDMYTNRIVEYIAKYYIKLDGKVDGIIFTAGGGENDPIIRKEVLNKLKPLGIKLDEKVNEEMMTRKGKEGKITTKDSKIDSYVIATDEELMIARDTYALANNE